MVVFLVICCMSQDALIMSLQRFPVVPFQITNFAVLNSDQLQHDSYLSFGINWNSWVMTINEKVEYSTTATAISYMDDVEQVFHIILLDCQLFCQFLCWWSSEVTIDIAS